MVFSSIIFLFLFLPLTLLFYFIVRKEVQNLFLLCASLLFYAWGESFYVLIMLVSIVVNYFSGLLIEYFKGRRIAAFFLCTAVVLNLGLLSVFKYLDFIVNNVNLLLSMVNIKPIIISPVHLPIGISFFTFQAISYIVDVYRNEVKAQRNPINIGMYISLFPQLIAGPIIRYHDVAKQIVKRIVTRDDFAEGIRRFVLGLGKKVLIANPLGLTADKIFVIASQELTAPVAWLGIICYIFQIYFDFSGYSDMAIGLGRMFGFHFLENFNYPYISQSFREFWQRWHISLSNWFRDYLYIPLGGNRHGQLRTYINLVTIFFLCGLWHGASWNYVIWGMFHGFFLAIERLGFSRLLKILWRPLRHVYFIFTLIVSFVIFRTDTISSAVAYLRAMFGFAQADGILYHINMYFDLEIKLTLIVAMIGSVPVFLFISRLKETILKRTSDGLSTYIDGVFEVSKTAAISLILLVSVMYLAAGAYNPFIYFRF